MNFVLTVYTPTVQLYGQNIELDFTRSYKRLYIEQNLVVDLPSMLRVFKFSKNSTNEMLTITIPSCSCQIFLLIPSTCLIILSLRWPNFPVSSTFYALKIIISYNKLCLFSCIFVIAVVIIL